MSIPFQCPHCGKSMVVEDRFAGQTGPCAACGKSITIPVASGPTHSSHQSGGGTAIGVIAAIGIVAVLACLGIGGLFATLLIPAAAQTGTAAKKSVSTNNLKQILIAMHNYHDVNGHWPPAYVADENGKPLYSWRVLLLPYLEQEALYRQFDKTKAWDDPANIGISQTMLDVFRSPADGSLEPDGTSYFVLIGPSTMFTGKDATRMADVTDGTSNTIAVIELQGIRGSWAAPIDPQLSAVNPVLAPGQLTPAFQDGTHVGFGDGSVRFLPNNLQPGLLQLLFIRNDGQVVPYDF